MKVSLAFLSNTLFNFAIGLLLARFLGPDEYGRFAVAIALAVAVQTIAFDWTRLAATRFYSERVRETDPTLRATVDASLAIVVLVLGLATAALVLANVELPLSRGLFALAIATAVANGVFDLQAAMMRARFRDGIYARLVIGKNILSLGLTVGGAALFGSATIALLGVVMSMAGSLVGIGRHLVDPAAHPRRADGRLAGRLFRYALPIVLANLAYQSIPLLDRLVIARLHGYAASGQFSFAYDIGLRTVSAIGSMLDVLLFQIAVRADEIHGTAEAKRQLGDNLGMVFAILAPACAGCWLVLPSFEAIVAPPEFRGSFARDFALLLPGLFCYALLVFGLQPLFLIRKTTLPLVLVAVTAALANVAWVALQPTTADPSVYAVGASATLALGFVLLTLAALWTEPKWPRARDVGATALGTGLMILVVRSLPEYDPGVGRLVLQAGVGAVIYAGVAMAANLCGWRQKLAPMLKARL